MQDNYNDIKNALHLLRSNASNILSLLHIAQKENNPTEILEKMPQVIKNHFERVVALDIEIPKENKKEHRDMINYVAKAHTEWRDGTMTDVDYAETLHFRLFNHFSIYFQSLLEESLGASNWHEFNLK